MQITHITLQIGEQTLTLSRAEMQDLQRLLTHLLGDASLVGQVENSLGAESDPRLWEGSTTTVPGATYTLTAGAPYAPVPGAFST